ncbi:MAG TPA: hypothetical protein ENK57_24125, partial [Polyangiaceae bacterium]|nr:hypothetical protein [Polyangiaceae bacterium]
MRRAFIYPALPLVLLASGCGRDASQPSGPRLESSLPAHAEEPQEAPPSQEPEDPHRARRDAFEAALLRAYPRDAPTADGVVRYELTAAPTDVPQLDGQALAVWAYNGQVPGPVLRVRLGQEIEVQLHNGLPQPTSIHWHGVRVPNAMDGVPGVTQDPVPPGGDFTYRFTPKDAGTFWFHPHIRTSEQVERGLYGVLVV